MTDTITQERDAPFQTMRGEVFLRFKNVNNAYVHLIISDNSGHTPLVLGFDDIHEIERFLGYLKTCGDTFGEIEEWMDE